MRFFPLAFSPDRQTILTRDAEQTVRLRNAVTGETLGASLGHRGPVTAGAFSLNGRTAVTVEDQRTVRLWDAATGEVIDELRHNDNDTVEAVAFSPDGRTVATGTWVGRAWLWDVATRKPAPSCRTSWSAPSRAWPSAPTASSC